MKMNGKMSSLLMQMNIAVSDIGQFRAAEPTPAISTVDGCVVITDEYERNRHVKVTDFPDRTGFECFINHAHLPYQGTRQSLIDSLGFAIGVRDALGRINEQREFLTIVSIADGTCTVRFHQCRPSENWISSDLEGYGDEALLLLTS
jgi:hypothetical protein